MFSLRGLLCRLLHTASFNEKSVFKAPILFFTFGCEFLKKCYIFGSVETNNFYDIINEEDFVIAADGGLTYTKKFNLKPDLIVGDFDSLDHVPKGENVIRHPEIKDETDTILAIDSAIKKGYENFVIYGCLGGRLDHTFASIQTAAYITENGGNVVFKSDEYFMTIIKNNSISFSKENEGYVSVFSYTEKATGVTEKGLFYELENAQLTASYPLGVSNRFIGKESLISVQNGKLCIIWNGTKGIYYFGGKNE